MKTEGNDLIRAEAEQKITNEERASTRSEFCKKHGAEAKEEARKLINKEAIAKTKDKQAHIERRQMETQTRAELTKEIGARFEAQFEERVATELTKRISSLWETVQKKPPGA